MRRLMLAIALTLSLGGCAGIQKIEAAFSTLTGASVSPAAVVVAANTFDALEATATNYLKLKRCIVGGNIVCRDPRATAAIIPAVRSGRIARDNLLSFLKANPGQLGPSGLYAALQTAIGTLQAAYAQYHVGG